MRAAPVLVAAMLSAACGGDAGNVANPHPVRLRRPSGARLSEVASLGRLLFFDSTLSASGRVSCATCHRPEQAYASDRLTAPLGRAVPSLQYVYRTPNFSVGPDVSDADAPPAPISAAPRPAGIVKVAGADPAVVVARGGLFWDGRVNTLQTQAMGPLFNAEEMGNRDARSVADRLRRSAYASSFAGLFGASVLDAPERLVDEAMFAVARFQIEDSSFHPYASRYDAYLEGRATLSASEWRGLQAFDDPARGNCAACHRDRPTPDGYPPMFTDYEYAALAVPRNSSAAGAGTNERSYDLGVCGPARTDLSNDARYCGLFRTPSLRNVATRSRFFHNGVYRTLDDVLAFYNFREVRPERVYSKDVRGTVAMYDDLPPRYHANVDTMDAPFDRKREAPPPMSDRDVRDIIAFLRTLTDAAPRR